MVQTKLVEKIKNRILFSINFFLKSCCFICFYGKICYNWTGHIDIIIRRMRFACWIIKATNTHSECAILIAFPRQQWLRKHASVQRNTHDACLVIYFSYSVHAGSIYFLQLLNCYSIILHRRPARGGGAEFCKGQ